MLKHGSVIRPTMLLASLDIKTAFGEARPRHVAKIVESHDTHGWLIAAFLREMSGLEGKANVRMQIRFQSVSPPGECRSSPFVAKDGHAAPGQCGRRVGKKKNGSPLGLRRRQGTSDLQLHVGRQLLDLVPLQKEFGTDAAGLIEEAVKWDLVPKPASLGWTSTTLKRSVILQLTPCRDVTDFPF